LLRAVETDGLAALEDDLNREHRIGWNLSDPERCRRGLDREQPHDRTYLLILHERAPQRVRIWHHMHLAEIEQRGALIVENAVGATGEGAARDVADVRPPAAEPAGEQVPAGGENVLRGRGCGERDPERRLTGGTGALGC